jgi:uncharacterized membrane-anchored protein YjiN (DUF445 family)
MNYERLEKVIEKLANSELTKHELSENYYGFKANVYPTKYGLQVSAIILTKKPFSQKDADIFYVINKEIKTTLKSAFGDYVDNIYASVQTAENYEQTKWWFEQQKNLNENKKNITELDRTWRDQKYEKEYNRIKNKISKPVENMIESYFEDDDFMDMYDTEEKRIITYNKKTQVLYYNRDIADYMSDVLPSYLWARHGQHLISDLFEEYFPEYKVKTVTAAGMF